MSAIPITDTEARALADAIEQVSRSQPPETVLKLVEMALERAPQQPLVLNAAGGYSYRSGNARRARELFEKAVAADGNSKVLWLNLSNACRALGDNGPAAQALEKALAIDPRYVIGAPTGRGRAHPCPGCRAREPQGAREVPGAAGRSRA